MRTAKGNLALAAVLAGSVLAVIGAPGAALAQSGSMRAEIPFEFQFGNTKMPAGTYIVHRTGDAIQLTDGKGHSAFVLSDAIAKPESAVTSQLVFTRYGDRSFLSQVRWSGYPSARGLIPSKDEIALQKASKSVSVASISGLK